MEERENDQQPASLPKDLEEVLGRLARGLEAVYGVRYRGLVLYGSYARGEARRGSDVDLLVLLEGERGEEDRVRRTWVVLRMVPVVWPLSLQPGYVRPVLPVGVPDSCSAVAPFVWSAREAPIARG